MAFEKKVFVQKTYTSPLYRWSPSSFEKNPKPTVNVNTKPYYCNALPNSQGEDWVVTYAYIINVTPSGQQQRLAYVECDYVV